MATLKTHTLDEVVELDERSIGVLKALIDAHGRQQAMEITGLTFYQLKESYANGAGTAQNLRAMPAEAYRQACRALGIEPEGAKFKFRAHRTTKKERAESYVPLTPKIRDEVRLFIRGRTVRQAAEDLGTGKHNLGGLYNPKSRVRNIAVKILEKVRASNEKSKNSRKNVMLADEHPMLHIAGYRRIQNGERHLIERFLTGGTIEEAVTLLQYSGFKPQQNRMVHWLRPSYRSNLYVSNLAYELMASVIGIRAAAGYYGVAAGASEKGLHREEIHRPGNIKNTSSRRKVIDTYVSSFNSRPKYAAAAKALGVDAPYLKRFVNGNIHTVPAALYVRVLEATGTVELAEEDRKLIPYIGRASELESILETYSLKTLAESVFKPAFTHFERIKPYIEEPEAYIVMLLQEIGKGKSPDAAIKWLEDSTITVRASSYFERIGRYLIKPGICRGLFLERLNECGDKDGLMKKLEEYAGILERNAAVLAANKAPQKPITTADFKYFFEINGATRANHAGSQA